MYRMSQGFGGVAVVQDRSSLYLYNSTVKDSFATDVAGAILGTGSAVVVLDGSTIQNATGSVGGAIKNEGVSTVSIVNGSKIVNCTATSAGAAYYGDSGGSIYVSRSVIANNVVLGSDGGGFYLARGEAATIDPNSSFQNNVAARYGGAVFATGGAVITITGPTIVTGNQAAQTGGALFMDSMANLTLQGPNLIINGNIAPIGSLAAFMSPPGGYLSRPKILESSGISGEIYVFYTATSVDMMNSGAFVGMSNVHLAGRAATLNIANVTSINNTSINFASTIPEFSVYAVDIFDNLVPVNYASPVIVSVQIQQSTKPQLMEKQSKPF
ncbi:hypothetical protein BCR33DRAFT_735352 [Rhizoclosmatium globosum]|uniref:Right handed beta helix domain-containing protein n=1 Tax=Rhizoclosmatium globosum TaxID=329046 RepID=A0A1Y2CN50_9FUNG|nr:hypothetical protein BCR33DRAFT_735352 [Rhizoclosmatium globosum]|eukprot:ORY48461.1 hypothetical protein BCR33DRAFT_735352 [Rhizoclosmatium globosum]